MYDIIILRPGDALVPSGNEPWPELMLTHWSQDKLAAIFQTTFSKAFREWKCINFDQDAKIVHGWKISMLVRWHHTEMSTWPVRLHVVIYMCATCGNDVLYLKNLQEILLGWGLQNPGSDWKRISLFPKELKVRFEENNIYICKRFVTPVH